MRSYDGLSDEQIESFDPSKVADKIKQYADPEVHFELYKPTVDGNRYIVIRVLPFQIVPHICSTSYADILEEAAVYVRGEGARTIKFHRQNICGDWSTVPFKLVQIPWSIGYVD